MICNWKKIMYIFNQWGGGVRESFTKIEPLYVLATALSPLACPGRTKKIHQPKICSRDLKIIQVNLL